MRNLLILLPGPYLARDQERWGINFLKKNFLVNVIDYTAWINKNFWNEYSQQILKSEESIIISNEKDFLNFISTINSPIVIDSWPANKKTNWMRKILKKKNSLFVALNTNFIPVPRKKFIFTLKNLFKKFFKCKTFSEKLIFFFKKI